MTNDDKRPTAYVSRGGEKLASVAGKLGLNFKNKMVLDVGSSTGGFTDFALQHGAVKVYAVDAGTNQLDPKLRQNPKVVVMEKTDIRDVRSLPDAIDMVVIDVSFTSLESVLPAVLHLITPSTLVVAMAKPHFEAERAADSKHKGVVKNDKIRRDILKDVELFIKKWFVVLGKADSNVRGRKGNQERFFLLQPIKNPQAPGRRAE